MATITIIRSKELMNRLRGIQILVDENRVGAIGDGETKSFSVTPGEHKLRAQIDWCGSKGCSFTIKEGEDKHFKLCGFRYSQHYTRSIALISIALVLLNVFVHNAFVKIVTIGFCGMLVLFITYIMTLGRNRYLRMYEVEKA